VTYGTFLNLDLRKKLYVVNCRKMTTTTTIVSHEVDSKMYYIANDLVALGASWVDAKGCKGCKGCNKTARKLIIKHRIPDTSVFFGTFDKISDSYKTCNKRYTRAIVFIAKDWADLNHPKLRHEPTPSDDPKPSDEPKPVLEEKKPMHLPDIMELKNMEDKMHHQEEITKMGFQLRDERVATLEIEKNLGFQLRDERIAFRDLQLKMMEMEMELTNRATSLQRVVHSDPHKRPAYVRHARPPPPA
jgi:hypothetical protein